MELTTHETVSLSSGAVAFSLPVISLPQRGGLTLSIGFALSGNQYVLRETGNSYQTGVNQSGEIAQLQTTVQNGQVTSAPWGTILHPNVPTLSADSSYAGTDSHNANPPGLPVDWINKPEYCMQNWTFTDWDGSSHSFPGTRDCNNGDGEYFQWVELYPLATVSTVSNDESNYILDASNTNDIRVIKRDGPVYHFDGGYVKPPSAGSCNYCISMQDYTLLGYYGAFFSSIVDPNGNTITASPTNQGLTIVDTLNRQITVSSNAITYTAQNGSGTKSVSANVTQLASSGTTVAWPVDYDSYQTSNSAGPCSVDPINTGTIEFYDGFQQPTVIYQGPGFHDTGQYPAQTSYQITLPNPNGANPPPTYTLTFDVLGNVIKVQYPSGGYTKYDYLYGRIMQSKNFGDSKCIIPTNELLAKHECAQSNGSCTPAPTATATNACVAGFPSEGEATTCYSGLFSAVAATNGSGTNVTVTDPYGNASTHSSAGNTITSGAAGYIPYYKAGDAYYSGTSNLLKSVTYSFSDSNTGCVSATGPWMLQPCDITTTYAVGNSTISSKKTVQYQAPYNPTQIKEYDFSGNLLKTTSPVWESGGIYSDGMAYNTITNVESGPVGVTTLTNMIDHLQSLTITDGVTGTNSTKTFAYDSKGNLQQTSISGTSPISGASVSSLTTLYTPLDSYGRPTQVTDPKGNVTKYSYTDSWYDNSCNVPSGSQAYLTSVTNALQQTTSYKWDSCNGGLGSVTDANSQTTSFVYDELDRTLQINYPDGGAVSNSYTDSIPNSIQTTRLQTPDPSVVNNTVMDGFARGSETQLTSDPAGTDFVDTAYDGLGRVASVSNPYRSGNPIATTQYIYDALSRKTRQIESDGTSNLQWCYNGISNPASPQSNCRQNLTSFTGTWVDSSDEAANNWQRISNAEGSLLGVVEPYSFETDYTYDGVGDLVQVDQWGGAKNTPGERQRKFSYDALSRLTSAANPESGTVLYTYPNAGSLCAGDLSLPCTKTDARVVTTNYSYDPLNRVQSKTFTNDPTGTLSSCYQYDSSAYALPVANLVGRVANSWTQSGACPTAPPLSTPNAVTTLNAVTAYDPMGRLWNEATCTPGSCSSLATTSGAGYDLGGNMTSLSYPDGRTVAQSFDGAARLNSAKYATWGTTAINQSYLTVANGNYDPAGHLIGASFGNGTSYSASYNNREWIASLGYKTGTNTLWSKNLTWYPNGNLEFAADPFGNTRQFTYDSLNRLTSAQDIAGTVSSSGQTTDTSDEGQDNTLQNSQQFGALGWGASNGSMVANATAAPDGSMTAGVFTANASGSWMSDSVPNPALYDGALMTASVWLKLDSGTTGSVTTTVSIISTGNQSQPTITPTTVTLTSNWQQVQVTGAANQNGQTSLVLKIGDNLSTGQAIDVWGPEMEPVDTSSANTTNILQSPQQVVSPAWKLTYATVGSITVPAPDSSSTAIAILATSGSTDSYFVDNVADPATYNGAAVKASIWLRTPQTSLSTNIYLVNIGNQGWGAVGSQPVTLTPTWQQYTVAGTLQQALTELQLVVGNGNFVGTDEIDIWQPDMQANAVGTPGVTNILPSSQQVVGSSWTIYSGSAQANSDTAPDGTQTATTVTPSSGATNTRIIEAASNASQYSGDTVTESVYLRLAPGSDPVTISLSLANYTPTSGSIISTATENLSTTWQRFDLYGPNIADITKLQLSIGGNNTFAAGQTIEVWGAQMVVGSSEGNYVATTTTTTNPSNGQQENLAANGLNESYSYDSFGNLQQSGNVTFEQAFTSANQLSGWNYDVAGNLLSDQFGGNYTYDASGMVTTDNGTTYYYDPAGNRVGKSGPNATDTIYFGGRPIARLSGGSWTDLIYGVGGLLAEVPGTQTGLPVYRMTDHLGSAVGTISSTGAMLSLQDYAPFGQVISGGTSDPYKFTGKERDAESGNDYFGARYYGSAMGRFSSPDPSGLAYADPTNPQSLNLYAYVLNNPLVNVDPNGLDCVTNNGDGTATINSGDCAGKDPNNEYYYDCGASDGCLKGITSANLTQDGGISLYNGTSNTFSTISNYGYTNGAEASGTGDEDMPSDQLSPYAQAVIGEVARQMAWVPNNNNNPFKEWPLNGNIMPGAHQQDQKCSAGPVIGPAMDSIPGVLAACQWHDNKYIEYNCNATSWISPFPGPCKAINYMLLGKIYNALPVKPF